MERVKPEIQEKVIEHLNELIGEAGGVVAFAKSIDVKRDTVNNWLLGKSDIRVNDLVKISKKYDVSVDYLLGLTEVSSVDMNIKAACEFTGLTEESMYFMLNCKDFDSRALNLVNCLFTSECLSEVTTAVDQAISSSRIYRIEGEPKVNTTFLPIMQAIFSQVGRDKFKTIPDTIPEMPPGTMLLSASDATEFYKNKALKPFSDFIDAFVITESEEPIE